MPINENTDTYTVQLQDSGDILELPKEKLRDIDPNTPLQNNTDLSPLVPWLKDGAKVTLYLQHIMKDPKQGYIYKNDDETWYFKPGQIKDSKTRTIPLKDFEALAQSLITNKKLFKRWKNKSTMLTAQIIRAKSNVIAKHISAKALSNLIEPSLATHHLLNTKDKDIWDRSYKEEYNGLQNLDTWEVNTESEYKRLLPVVGKALPTKHTRKIHQQTIKRPHCCSETSSKIPQRNKNLQNSISQQKLTQTCVVRKVSNRHSKHSCTL